MLSCQKDENETNNNSSSLTSDLVGEWVEYELYFGSNCDVSGPSDYVSNSNSGFTLTINSDLSYEGDRSEGGTSFTIGNDGLLNINCQGGVAYVNRVQSPFYPSSTTPSSYSGDIIYINYDFGDSNCDKTTQYRYKKL